MVAFLVLWQCCYRPLMRARAAEAARRLAAQGFVLGPDGFPLAGQRAGRHPNRVPKRLLKLLPVHEYMGAEGGEEEEGEGGSRSSSGCGGVGKVKVGEVGGGLQGWCRVGGGSGGGAAGAANVAVSEQPQGGVASHPLAGDDGDEGHMSSSQPQRLSQNGLPLPPATRTSRNHTRSASNPGAAQPTQPTQGETRGEQNAAAHSSTGGPISNNNPTSTECCSICLGDYERGDLLRTLPCDHAFHVSCIDLWLARDQVGRRSCNMAIRYVTS